MQSQQYREKFGISQSKIKDFRDMSLDDFYEIHVAATKESPKKDAYVLGDLVDLICLFPDEDLSKIYFNCDSVEYPSEAVRKIFDNLFKITQKSEEHANDALDYWETELLVLAKDFNKNYSKEAKLRTLKASGENYYNLLKKCNGRQIVDNNTYQLAFELATLAKTHPKSKKYFTNDSEYTNIFQLEIFTPYVCEYGTIDLKGAIDILHIDHKAKTCRIVDLKTSSVNTNMFTYFAKKFGYPLQMSFYSYLLQQWLRTSQYYEYSVLPPINLVVSPKGKVPYIYKYKPNDLYAYMDGRTSFPFLQGWKESLDNIVWHYVNDNWSCSREQYVNGMEILNFF